MKGERPLGTWCPEKLFPFQFSSLREGLSLFGMNPQHAAHAACAHDLSVLDGSRSAFRPQCLRRINAERASQWHRARQQSDDKHDTIRRKEQKQLTRRSEAHQRRQGTADEYARADLQERA